VRNKFLSKASGARSFRGGRQKWKVEVEQLGVEALAIGLEIGGPVSITMWVSDRVLFVSIIPRATRSTTQEHHESQCLPTITRTEELHYSAASAKTVRNLGGRVRSWRVAARTFIYSKDF